MLLTSVLVTLALAPSPKGQEAAKVTFLQNARVVVRPGQVLDSACVVIDGDKIVRVGTGLTPPAGAEVVDCQGLTAYPGLIHPFMRVSVDGLSPAQAQGGGPGGGGPGGGGGGQGRQNQTVTQQAEAMARRDKDPFGIDNNLLARHKTAELKQKDASGFDSLLKNGFVLAQVSASGGIIGPTSAVYRLDSLAIDPSAVVANPGNVPVSMSARGAGSYPGSTMGVMAFIRQAFCDADRLGRVEDKGANPGLANLVPVMKKRASVVFDALNEVGFFQAKRVADEFGLQPVYGFSSDAGSVKDLLKGGTVLLRGSVPSKPTIGESLETASLSSVRDYFGEIQSAAELDKAGVTFAYAPSTTDPLSGIRTYVRAGLSRDTALASMTTVPAELLGVGSSAGTIEAGKSANILLTEGDLFESSSQVMAVWSAGRRAAIKMPDRKKPEDLKTDSPLAVMAPNHAPFPAPAETEKAFRLYRNATVWTQGPQGVIRNGDVLIQDGKVTAVGRGLKAPAGCEVLDATGKHITPGIWDCHSHTGINGGVNESTNMVTIECRIADVTNHRSTSIYNQLSGGTVGANQLHGSANVIGGQNNTVKWRWGQRPNEFRVQGAPEGVKFALGQNPIREDASGFGAQQQPVGTTLLTWRPRTRMGNEESIRRALQQGKEYNQQWQDFRDGKTKVEPRRDLQREALGEVVSGKRWVHSHGYRADEMLALIRILDEFGGKLATLQHVLEGYKIADEMADRGVGGSTFSDWWGYKLEAYDAIPYNASLMAARGVSVSVNSDSDNHARRLNQEAAKSMRYGGASAEEALGFVTLEPAKQLGIADRTGSLEAGKDADMVVWSAEPMSVFAMCLETYVDGVKRFDRANDAAQRAQREAELKEAKKVLAGSPSEASPFVTSGGSSNTSPAAGDDTLPTTAKFGIGPIKGEPGTMRYPRKSVLITGATVHPMAGKPFVGDVLIGSNGKILETGPRVNGNGAVAVDGRGKHLYPGMIDPSTTIGLNEIGQVPASDDSSERGNFHPDYRVERVINPEWETLGVARQQGVLTVLVRPAGQGIAGQAALVNTEGYTWEDLTVQGGVALSSSASGGSFDFGEDLNGILAGLALEVSHEHDGHSCDHDDQRSGQNRQNQGGGESPLPNLTRAFDQARQYQAVLRNAAPDKPMATDLRMEALIDVLEGETPVMLSVTSATEIKNAVAWAEKERIRVVLYGCSGAGEIAEWLAAKQVPICLGAVYRMPTGDMPVDAYYSLPAKLTKAGVKFCLTTENDKDVRQLRDQAGWAAAYGVDREEAARLVTLRTAEVLGIADRLGAITTGLDGTVILTDGELVETKTRVVRAWIQGREVSLENKQTRLYDKYRTRPRAVKK